MPRPHNLPRDMRAGAHRRQVGMSPDIIASIQAGIPGSNGNGNGNANGNGNSGNGNDNGNGKGKGDSEDGNNNGAPARTTAATTKPATQAPAQTTQSKAETKAPAATKQTTQEVAKVPSDTATQEAAPSTTAARHTPPSPATSEATDDTESSTSSTKASTTSSKAAMTTTRTSASRTIAHSSSASISPSASADGANAGAKGGVSNGGIAGIVVGLILGIIVIGGLAGFLYRRYKSRDYSEKQPWTKMRDDVTPYRDAKRDSDDEFYGGGPMIQHQQHLGFNRELDSGAYGVAPDSSYDAANMAGFGAGAAMASSRAAYGAYPDSASHVAASYDQDGRPYTPNSHHTGYEQGYDHGYDQNGYPQQQQNPFEDGSGGSPHNTSPQQQNFGGPRQLVGPGQVYGGSVGVPVPAPVPLGRPEPPQSYDDIAAAEMYADDRYADDHLSVPQAMPMPSAHQEPLTRDARLSPSPTNEFVNNMDVGQDNSLQLQHADLPTLAPMTPLLDELSLDDDDVPAHHTPSPAAAAAAASAQPYDDGLADMYNEVARAAGVHDDNAVTYQHGQPLSPLREVPTPKSTLDSAQVPDAGYFAPPPPALDTRDLPAPSGRPLPSTPVKATQDDAYGGI